MGFFGFAKKARKAAAEVKKFEKRDLAQAVVNAADFTSRAMSILVDGVLVAGVITLIIPMLKKP